MRAIICGLILLCAAPAFAQHPDVVGAVKSELQARGVDLSGPCGAFAITKRVAWQLRGEGAGLLDKPSGNNCQGYAVDIIAYPGTRIFDTLIDAGGANGPAWQDGGVVDANRYRPAFDPGDSAAPPPVVIAPPPVVVVAPPPSFDYGAIILAELRAERVEAARFRQEVRDTWKKVMVFAGKYIAPIIGAIVVGRKTA